MSAASAVQTNRSALWEQYCTVRQASMKLASRLSAEDQMVQSMADASPTKWHLAHTTWFFETFILLPHAAGYRAFDPRFTFLFNSYYKSLEEGHPVRATRGTFSRPSLIDVHAYRARVDEAMEKLVATEAAETVADLLELGLHHEQQHQELILTDIKHGLWTNPLRPAYCEATATPETAIAPVRWIEFDGGLYEIGHSGVVFAFDNEGPRHSVFLRPFQLASRPVTNAEFLEFMHEGGYRRPELWLSEGWDTVCAAGWKAPFYWEPRDGEWHVFTTAGMQPVREDEPVCHISFFEADAYARWAGARLPLEAEWEVTANGVEVAGNFVESERFHPAPSIAKGDLKQLYGDVWEWTASPYLAYPGFRAPQGALGEYNQKFMCNQLVLRGGSCATPQSHIRDTYRNFFPPAARWQFMGLRLANDRN